jgi:hypothetical protein
MLHHMTGSLQFREYPGGRAGQYRKQNLTERYGADIFAGGNCAMRAARTHARCLSKKLTAPYKSGPSKAWLKTKIRMPRPSNASIRWNVLRRLISSLFMCSPGRRLARIVKLIGHAKSTDAAHSCPTLLNGEETAIAAAPSSFVYRAHHG